MIALQSHELWILLAMIVLPLAGWCYSEMERRRLYEHLMEQAEKYEGDEDE